MRKVPLFSKIVFTIMMVAMLSNCERKGKTVKAIQIKGSDTEVNLVQRLSEVFMEKNPDVSIAVTGGGSGTGIAALINNQTDIANSSRLMKDTEIKQAESRGVNPIAIVFALDGLALITHKSLQIASLTLDQVGKIYKEDISNWKKAGGPDLPISLYGRQSNSGTFVYFRDNVVKGDYSQNMKMMNGTAQIVEAIRQDKAGIGYVGIGYVVNEHGQVIEGITVLKIASSSDLPAVTPLDPGNVKKGLYPVSRPLYQYTNNTPTGNLLEFIKFELSVEGQNIVSLEEYYPVTPEYMEHNRTINILD
jgi:phosphate transport system substrate-binding protein